MMTPGAKTRTALLAGWMIVGLASTAGATESDFIVLKADPSLPVLGDTPSTAPAPAAPPAETLRSAVERPPSDTGYIHVIDQDLRALIIDYARGRGLTAQVGGDVRQRVANVQIPLDPDAFIRTLQSRFSLTAFIDGDRLIVGSQGTAVTKLIPLGTLSLDQLSAQLKAASVPVDAKSLKYINESNSVMVTAPAAIVAQVAGILDAARVRNDSTKVQMVRFGKSGG